MLWNSEHLTPDYSLVRGQLARKSREQTVSPEPRPGQAGVLGLLAPHEQILHALPTAPRNFLNGDHEQNIRILDEEGGVLNQWVRLCLSDT